MTVITAGEGPVVRIAGREVPAPDTDIDATVAAVGPTGVPAVEPLVAVTSGGQTAFYTRCSPERVTEIVSKVDDGDAGDADAVVDHDPGTTRLPVPDLPGLGTGTRAVLGACGWRRPASPEDHEAAGGFGSPDPEAVFAAGAALHGRGWGDLCHDEACGPAWETVRDGEGGGAVVVNAHGNDGDRLLLESAPFEVLDGATALATAVDAAEVILYASEDDAAAVATAREAVAAHPDPAVPLDVVTGPPEHRAAEPTMAIEAVEGNHRLEARLTPPGPEEVGLHGRPTLVHTPRTLAHLAAALRGGEAPETRVVTVTGDVDAPATVELPESASLAATLDAVDAGETVKAACVGGRFGGVTRDLDVAVDPASLTDAGLGTEGQVHLLGTDRCVVEFVGSRTQYAADENCGRCVPCREGTTQLAGLLRDVYDGTYDPEGIEELVRVMETSSICAFGVEAGRPARTALAEFESEFEAHADGRCPAGACLDPLEAS
jgi:NADH-quinone oxidoreductase subunit F